MVRLWRPGGAPSRSANARQTAKACSRESNRGSGGKRTDYGGIHRSDLEFILVQIVIAERQAAGEDLRDILPNVQVPWGLRKPEPDACSPLAYAASGPTPEEAIGALVRGLISTRAFSDRLRAGPPVW
jgi:hypothetical protein